MPKRSAANSVANRHGRWRSAIFRFIGRFSDENAELAFAEYLLALYANRPLDLIISIGAPAAGFIQWHRKQLFPITPMLFTAGNGVAFGIAILPRMMSL
jgi:hypothetical protein